MISVECGKLWSEDQDPVEIPICLGKKKLPYPGQPEIAQLMH